MNKEIQKLVKTAEHIGFLRGYQAGYNEAFRASLKIINKEFNKK